jgi:photosystem II stability/assembly factor-like uncharacterized protein
MLSKTNSPQANHCAGEKLVLLKYLRLQIFIHNFIISSQSLTVGNALKKNCEFSSINKRKSYFFIFIFFLITSNQYLLAQWKFANGPYEATLLNISIEPVNPNIIYTVGEGVFRSTNSGEYWTEIEPDTLLASNLEPVIKVDPNNSGIVYYGGHGALFKSYDYGDNWEIIGFENRSVTSIEIDPVNSDIIYAGLKNTSDDVIWKSTDAGQTWEKKTNGIPVSQLPFQNCNAIKINPLNNNSLIAAISSEGIYKSIDGGNNWTFLRGVQTYDLEILPWDTTSVIAAASGGIFKSTDDGLTWRQILNTGANCVEIDSITKEFYAGLNKSTDEGNTWIPLYNPELPNSFSLSTSIYDIKIDRVNNNILYIATGAGIYKSSDKGISWIQSFDGLNKFYAYNIKISPSNSSIIYATGREGIHRSNDGGKSWKYIGGGAAENFIAIDPTNSDIVYVAHVPIFTEFWLWRTIDGGNIWEKKLISQTRFDFIEFDPANPNTIYTRYTDYSKSVLCKSTDRGETWELINTPASPTSMLISKENSFVIYIGSRDGVYKTSDGGINWTYLGLSEDNSNIILSFAPEDENIIYASVYGKGVFKTTDGGLNWEERNNGLLSINTTSLILDPKQINRIFIGSDSGTYVSSNGGDVWSKFKPEHPLFTLYHSCIDTLGTGRIFAVSKNAPGVYVLDSIYSDISFVEENNLLQNFILYQNYPNPFNSSTIIKFVLPSSENIKLEVYDLLGRRIITLIDEYKNRGEHSIEWNGKNEKSKDVSSGLYFSHLLTSNKSLSKKMVIMK